VRNHLSLHHIVLTRRSSHSPVFPVVYIQTTIDHTAVLFNRGSAEPKGYGT